jgi:hypothetical protein
LYGTVAVLAMMAVGDPMLMTRFGYEVRFGPHTAQTVLDKALNLAGVQPQPAEDETLQR